MVYTKNQKISSRQLGNEIMLYDSENDKVHILNETGIIIWNLLDGKNSLDNIKEKLSKQFPEVKSEEILKDVNEIIEKLTREGLIAKLD